ncbi:NAD-dependent epimerase/dehydratase family protein [Actinocrispum wychmicini]|uniref:Dihydroflavonol-4-reductase n=1 Tax=Actinocrispum wychmicini TaxID=1213861 RepID=A0A4R2JYC0_9PSEU|nr:NAD-dependent epimerase/dehydratase family protein [Actinocrispum wychmicini]TCO65603.1 dihydroflavonol-4-reductase [Actinocrispum wychmicini]
MTVLVTGGSGFLAGWCVRELLDRGYDVRTTVRDATRRVSSPVPVVRADLGSDDGWAEAVDGCEYVLHVASPFPRTEPKDPEELIRPARDGALRVLRAAFNAGVSRVVLTSSSSTIGRDETQWTDPATARPYIRSKILAEQAAWDFVAERGIRDKLVTIAPSAMLGPVRGPNLAYSLLIVSRLLKGEMPGLPRLGFSFVDVRDVAALHVRAMLEPAAAGQRFLADAGFLWIAEVADVLRARLGPAAAKVPTRRLPDIAVRLAAKFDSELKQVVGELGRRTTYSTDKAKNVLGWLPRPLAETIVDCAESLPV